MQCFTFAGCQICHGLEMTKYVPPYENGRKSDREVLFLGMYGGVGFHGCNINLDREAPANITDTVDSSRIIENLQGRSEPCFSPKMARVADSAYPRFVQKEQKKGFVVLSKPLITSRNILIRINARSEEDTTKRPGAWYTIEGRPRCVSRGFGVHSARWVDDLVVLHEDDCIVVVTAGSEEIDDQVLYNFKGRLIMAPANVFYLSGMKKPGAEEIQRTMEAGLAELPCIPEAKVL